MVITISNKGFIKRMPVSDWRKQKRGGRGSSGLNLKEDDFVEHLFIASTHSIILLFSNTGKVFSLKVHEIAQMKPSSRGKILSSLINISLNEEITACMSIRSFDQEDFVIMGTRKGIVKKNLIKAFSTAKKNGIKAILIDETDELIQAINTEGKNDILLATKKGMALRIKNETVRSMGRASRGVRGIKLKNGDEIAGVQLIDSNSDIMVISEKGYGKRLKVSEIVPHGRGTGGIKYIRIKEKTGEVVSIINVSEKDEAMIITSKGSLIRTAVNQIPVIGRNASGVKVVNVEPPDFVSTCGRIIK